MKLNNIKKIKISKEQANNTAMFAISLAISLALWIYVTSTITETYTRSFDNVEIQLVGESVLEQRGFVATELSTESVSVEVEGPRRVISRLNSSDIKAQINVSNITEASKTSMQYTISYPDGLDSSNIFVTRKIPESVDFSITERGIKVIPVKGIFNGSVKDGFMANPAEFEPESIEISGSQDVLDQITCAWVTFGEDQISDTYYSDCSFTLMNDNKDPIESNSIHCSTDVITATLPVLEIKSVPLAVTLKANAGANESNTDIVIEPSNIMIAGEKNLLSSINKITIAEIDLGSFDSIYSEIMPITLDDRLTNVEGISAAAVNLTINGLVTKDFRIGYSSITCINIPNAYNVTVMTKELYVTLRGTKEQIDKINSSDVNAVIDISEFETTTGTHKVNADIVVNGQSKVGVVGTPSVQIKIGLENPA